MTPKPVALRLEVASRICGLDVGVLTAAGRIGQNNFKGKAALYHVLYHAGYSYREIAQYLGRKDHSTVQHAMRRTQNDPLTQEYVTMIEKEYKRIRDEQQ